MFSQSKHAMATKPINECQQYWLDHLKRTAANVDSIVDYAKAQKLKPIDLYAGKTRLIKLGQLRGKRHSKSLQLNGNSQGHLHRAGSYLRHLITELAKAISIEDIEALLPHRVG